MRWLHRLADASARAAIARLTVQRQELAAQLRAERRAKQTQADLTARWRSIALSRAQQKEQTK